MSRLKGPHSAGPRKPGSHMRSPENITLRDPVHEQYHDLSCPTSSQPHHRSCTHQRHQHPAEELSKPSKSPSQEAGPHLGNCLSTEILLVPSPGGWEKDGTDKSPLVAHQFPCLEKGLSVTGPTISKILYQPGLQTGPQVLPPTPAAGASS